MVPELPLAKCSQMGVGGGGEGKLYIEFFHEGFCDGGFSRGGGTCNADYLEGEPGGLVFWFRFCHCSSVCTTDAIAIVDEA